MAVVPHVPSFPQSLIVLMRLIGKRLTSMVNRIIVIGIVWLNKIFVKVVGATFAVAVAPKPLKEHAVVLRLPALLLNFTGHASCSKVR
jgi:hypothetical protein